MEPDKLTEEGMPPRGQEKGAKLKSGNSDVRDEKRDDVEKSGTVEDALPCSENAGVVPRVSEIFSTSLGLERVVDTEGEKVGPLLCPPPTLSMLASIDAEQRKRRIDDIFDDEELLLSSDDLRNTVLGIKEASSGHSLVRHLSVAGPMQPLMAPAGTGVVTNVPNSFFSTTGSEEVPTAFGTHSSVLANSAVRNPPARVADEDVTGGAAASTSEGRRDPPVRTRNGNSTCRDSRNRSNTGEGKYVRGEKYNSSPAIPRSSMERPHSGGGLIIPSTVQTQLPTATNLGNVQVSSQQSGQLTTVQLLGQFQGLSLPWLSDEYTAAEGRNYDDYACPVELFQAVDWDYEERKVHKHDEERRAHKAFSCGTCGESFGYKDNLKRHELFIHENSRMFCCPHCPKIFYDFRSLKGHIEKKHRKTDPAALILPCLFCCFISDTAEMWHDHMSTKHREESNTHSIDVPFGPSNLQKSVLISNANSRRHQQQRGHEEKK